MLTSGGRTVPGMGCKVIIDLLHPKHLGDAVKPMATFAAKEGSACLDEVKRYALTTLLQRRKGALRPISALPTTRL